MLNCERQKKRCTINVSKCISSAFDCKPHRQHDKIFELLTPICTISEYKRNHAQQSPHYESYLHQVCSRIKSYVIRRIHLKSIKSEYHHKTTCPRYRCQDHSTCGGGEPPGVHGGRSGAERWRVVHDRCCTLSLATAPTPSPDLLPVTAVSKPLYTTEVCTGTEIEPHP